MTAEEYSRLPEDDQVHDLQAGVLLSEPLPRPRHGRIQVKLAKRLFEFVDARKLGIVVSDVGFLLSDNPDTIRGPDVAFIRRDRYDVAREGYGFFRGAPDLAVEILSPSNRPGEMHARVADLLAAGSTLVWVIDPDRRTADVYRALLSPRRVPQDGALDGEDVLPGFSVTVHDLVEL